ncbi:MAG: hypothetical protein LBU69_06265 [Deltaproteobacteria bacterium]|nr:hypothetical protein [Deltaproteobacteria bacterium]
MSKRDKEAKGTSAMAMIFLLALVLPLAWPRAGRAYGQGVLWGGRVLAWPLPRGQENDKLRAFLRQRDWLEASEANLVMSYLGEKYAPVTVSLTIGLMALARARDPGQRFKRQHDMWSLLLVSSRHFSCLRPIAKAGPITAKDHFAGEWAIARTPLQFALESGILLGPRGMPYKPGEVIDYQSGLPWDGNEALGKENALDAQKLRGILVGQLGNVFDGRIEGLPDRQLALASAFLAHAAERREEAARIFDSLSESWSPKGHEVDARLARAALGNPGLSWGRAKLIGHQSFVNVWFMALLELAREKGALPSSLWIWLRPTDRLLFYSLNQVGGGVAWAEAVGAYSHLEAEKWALKALPEPRVEPAVNALEKSLIQEGYLPAKVAGRGQGLGVQGPDPGACDSPTELDLFCPQMPEGFPLAMSSDDPGLGEPTSGEAGQGVTGNNVTGIEGPPETAGKQ